MLKKSDAWLKSINTLKNIIINGINSESQILYEELLNHGLDDVVFIDSNKELVNNLNHKSQNLIAYSGNPTSPEFLEFIIAALYKLAHTDHVYSEAEDEDIRSVANIFGITKGIFDQAEDIIKKYFVKASSSLRNKKKENVNA